MESPKGITRIAGPGSTIIAIPIAMTAMPITATINRFPCLTIFSIGPAASFFYSSYSLDIKIYIDVSSLAIYPSHYLILFDAKNCFAKMMLLLPDFFTSFPISLRGLPFR